MTTTARVIPNRADGEGPCNSKTIAQTNSCDISTWARSLGRRRRPRDDRHEAALTRRFLPPKSPPRIFFSYVIVMVRICYLTPCERNSAFLALAQDRSAAKSDSRQRAICCRRYCQRRDSDDQGRSHRQSRFSGTRSHAQAWSS